MSNRYFLYLETLAERDNVLLILAGFSLALVAAWVAVDWVVPIPYRVTIKRLYMIGGVGLYLLTILATGK